MVATYEVSIEGIERTKTELARLDDAIKSLRAGSYSSKASVTQLGRAKSGELFQTKVGQLEGRVQTAAQAIMLKAMNFAKEGQASALRAAVTPTGLSGKSHHAGGRNGPGRDDSGAMIAGLSRNVEVEKKTNATTITGYHGWKEERSSYFIIQEKGATKKHVPAANSLGFVIPPVTEYLRAKLRELKK